jgi:hypothetical protein
MKPWLSIACSVWQSNLRMESDRANRGANRGLRGHEKHLLARAQGITRPAAHPRTVRLTLRKEQNHVMVTSS